MPSGPGSARRGRAGQQEEEISNSFDAEARMAQVLGQPPRIAPQADGEYSVRVHELLEKLRARYGGS